MTKEETKDAVQKALEDLATKGNYLYNQRGIEREESARKYLETDIIIDSITINVNFKEEDDKDLAESIARLLYLSYTSGWLDGAGNEIDREIRRLKDGKAEKTGD